MFEADDYCLYQTVFVIFTDLAELRKKFEQDKEKLQQLKIKRTFKPF